MIKRLIDMFKRDFETVLEMISEPDKTIKVFKSVFKNFKLGSHLKEMWFVYLLMIAFFCAGYYFAGVQLNNLCVDYINDFIIPNNPSFFPELTNYSFNMTVVS